MLTASDVLLEVEEKKCGNMILAVWLPGVVLFVAGYAFAMWAALTVNRRLVLTPPRREASVRAWRVFALCVRAFVFLVVFAIATVPVDVLLLLLQAF